MKKRFFVYALTLLIGLTFSLTNSNALAQTTLKVGATPVPHAEILNALVPYLAEQGIKLQVIEFTDYIRPNVALAEGDLDANFFQHLPYLENFNKDSGTNLVSLRGVHVEPLGIYSRKIQDLNQLSRGAQVAIPNDVTNGGRALLLLQTAGLIKVDPKAGIAPTVFDITENKLNLRIIELEAAQLARALDDVAIAIINGNYALEAKLSPTKDALFIEGAESPYVNILAIRAGDENNPALLKLADALNSELVREFIQTNYPDSVVPAF